MLVIVLIVCFLFASIVMCGVIFQKDVFTSLLFLNVGTSMIALFICVLGSFKVNSSYIDIALIYFLLSVVVSSAYLKFFMQKHHKDELDSIKTNKKSP